MNLPSASDEVFDETEAPARARWKWVIVAALVCVLAVVFARPLYRAGKTWRGRSLAAAAEKLMEEKKWWQAAEKVRAAYKLAPADPGILQAMARFYSRVGAPVAEEFWIKYLALPEATVADRQEAVRFALQLNRREFADEQLRLLLKVAPLDSSTLELAVQSAIHKGDRAAALDFADQLIKAHPSHPSARLVQAQLLFSSTDSEQRNEGKRQLEELAKDKGTTGLNALRILAGNRSLPPEDLRSLAGVLPAHPLATIDDRLTAASLEIQLEPERREEVLDQTIQRFAQDGPDVLVALGRWANSHGAHSRVVDLVSLSESLKRQDLFLVRLDALAVLGRWSEIQEILKDEKTPLEETHRQLFLARAAHELGEPMGAEARWGEALRAAGKKPDALLYLGQYAQKVGNARMAEEAYRELMKHPGYTRTASVALVPLLEAKGETRALRDVMKQLVQAAPQEAAPRNDAAYLDLLLQENISAARQTAEQLMREHPNLLAHRTTVALARLREGDARSAAEVYQGIGEIPWDTAPPGWHAVYAAVLAANGETEKARETIALLPRERLKAEERALIALLE